MLNLRRSSESFKLNILNVISLIPGPYLLLRHRYISERIFCVYGVIF